MQKRVIAIIDDNEQDQPYSSKVKNLKLYSLQRRRERYELGLLYKYLEAGQTYLSIELSGAAHTPRNCKHNRHLRDSAYLLPYEKLKTVREESFIPRSLKSWNLLPRDVAEAPSFPIFKNRLDNLLKSLKDIPLPESGATHTTLLEAVRENRLHVRLSDFWRRPSNPSRSSQLTSTSRSPAC